MIKSALHNLSLSENNNKNITAEQKMYYKGLIVGIVSSLMNGNKLNFEQAIRIVKINLPVDHIDLVSIIPDWASVL